MQRSWVLYRKTSVLLLPCRSSRPSRSWALPERCKACRTSGRLHRGIWLSIPPRLEWCYRTNKYHRTSLRRLPDPPGCRTTPLSYSIHAKHWVTFIDPGTNEARKQDLKQLVDDRLLLEQVNGNHIEFNALAFLPIPMIACETQPIVSDNHTQQDGDEDRNHIMFLRHVHHSQTKKAVIKICPLTRYYRGACW
jgi:hypothetical protein